MNSISPISSFWYQVKFKAPIGVKDGGASSGSGNLISGTSLSGGASDLDGWGPNPGGSNGCLHMPGGLVTASLGLTAFPCSRDCSSCPGACVGITHASWGSPRSAVSSSKGGDIVGVHCLDPALHWPRCPLWQSTSCLPYTFGGTEQCCTTCHKACWTAACSIGWPLAKTMVFSFLVSQISWETWRPARGSKSSLCRVNQAKG